MAEASWGGMNPNSRGQLWSRWTFRIYGGRPVPLSEVELNAARWLRNGFGSAGRARVSERTERGLAFIEIEAEVEGVSAHDPGYVRSVRKGFRRFVTQGWGTMAHGLVEVTVLAGDAQDGRPRAQLVVLPKGVGE